MEHMWCPCGIPLEVTNRKCDIVDRVFHASRVFGHNPTLGFTFPPLWGISVATAIAGGFANFANKIDKITEKLEDID